MPAPSQVELHKMSHGITWQLSAVLLIATVINFGAVAVTGPVRPLDADGPEYLSIAQALVAGQGFVAPLSPWPNQPNLARVPLWPAAIAGALTLFPGKNPRAVLRYLTASLNVLCCLSLYFLTVLLTADKRLSAAVGIAAAIYPASIFLVINGYCEVLAVLLLCLGFLAVLLGGRWAYLGALLLGLVALVRSNFVIFPVCVLLIWIITSPERGSILRPPVLLRVAIAVLLFALPTSFWLVRNYEVSGRFPLLSSLEGETLYGSNNEVVTNRLADWGYWIMPDGIPGELPMQALARQMSEVQANDY
jgi:hypothetical protein